MSDTFSCTFILRMLIAGYFIIKENLKLYFPPSNVSVFKSNLPALPSTPGFCLSKYKS